MPGKRVRLIRVWRSNGRNRCAVDIGKDCVNRSSHHVDLTDQQVREVLEHLVYSTDTGVGSFRPFWGPPGWVWMRSKP